MQRFMALAASAAIGFGALGYAVAQTHGHGQHPAPATAAASEVEQAFRDASARMHENMDVKYTGDADRDFVAGMIPHHQGAIEMAKIVLRYGKDPEIRKIAEAVIRDQEREITEMRAWQARNK